MSLKHEKINAIKQSREFLRSLLDPKQTKRVPKAIRKQAYWCLRHFPADFDIEIHPDFEIDCGQCNQPQHKCRCHL